MTRTNQKTIAIIGGLSAGPAAAARARRDCEDCRILLFEKGNQISYATCGLPYAISGEIADREKLIIVAPSLLEKRFAIEMHLNEEILSVDTKGKMLQSDKSSYKYDKLIIATGATANIPPVDGIMSIRAKATLRTLEDFDFIQQNPDFKNSKEVTVIGGGLIGVELAENLAMMNKNVTIIEAGKQILPMFSNEFAYFAKTILENNKVKVLENTILNKVGEDDKKKKISISLSDGATINSDFIFLAAGITPNTKFISDIEKIGNGAIIVNKKMETSIKDIYAAGDCAAIINTLSGKPDYLPLGTHSNKGGRVAGANAAGADLTYAGGYGTAIIKIFDHTFARTGFNDRHFRESKVNVKSSLVNASASASYYPGSEPLLIKISYDEITGQILAAEAGGRKGVDKRIDVLATAIYARMKVDDLSELDLAYAPPYSPAKDPVIVAGHVAGNHRRHSCIPLNAGELKEYLLANPDLIILDLRSTNEIQKYGQLPNSKNLAIDDLRDQLGTLNKTLKYLLVCQKGIRGYIGSLILRHHGFTQVTNLAGGFDAYRKLTAA